MLSAIWLKTWRDLWLYKGQSIAVIAAVSVSTITLGIILMCYAMLSRALVDNYQLSSPSMITYSLNELYSSEFLKRLKDHPDIERIEFSRQISANITNQQGKQFPLVLYLVRDFDNMRLDVIDLEQGKWPLSAGQILVEKQAMSVLQAKLGEHASISSFSGLAGDVSIVGIGHDVSVAQAEWENLVYAYVTEDTLAGLGAKAGFDQIKIALKGDDLSQAVIPQKGNALRDWLNDQGVIVRHVTVATGEPPHANITNSMFMIQIAFGVMCSLLSAVLVVNLISAILSKQIFEIGVMRSLGAKPSQIKSIYLAGTLSLCLIGVAIGLPAAYGLAVFYAKGLAEMMNIEIFDYSVPPLVLLALIFLGLFIPLFTVLRPIWRVSKSAINKAFMAFDNASDERPFVFLDKLALMLPVLRSELRFSARNIWRRKARFILSGMVLAVGGAILMTSFNISQSMTQAVERDASTRQWHNMITLNKTAEFDDLSQWLGGEYQGFYQSKVKLLSGNTTEEQQAFALLQLNTSDMMLQPNMLEGQWLDGSPDQIVFSHLVANYYPEYSIGDRVSLADGRSYTLVGIAEVFGYPMLYAPQVNTQANGIFLTKYASLDQLNQVLDKHGLTVAKLLKADDAAKVIEDHFEIIFSLMLLLSVITLFIAGIGVILTTSINTLERAREIGVLRAIGASKSSLYIIVLGESIWLAIFSWFLACVVSIPISMLISYWLGVILVQVPFPLAISTYTMGCSLPILAAIALVSAYFPTRNTSSIPVKDALAST